ncbi:MAG TPA: hypothetical protein PK054_02450 [Anaerohalosphaeraceae bacterium]|nr:hypothetical protein [Anaerohalosphaeraceae bacterium]HOL87921.1 hypothetical protein [Anaerohalosphaeraceae bacterium]HPP55420.1 hypothetical protein [Anaerohalosphaeraceae bacterium]
MKKNIWVLIWLIILCGDAISLEEEMDRQRIYILTVLQVHSASEFTCRIDEWKQVKNLRLRVKVRGLEKIEGGETGQKLLEELFKSKKEFFLRNIEDKGYFYVLADVYAGKINLAEIISAQIHLLQEEKKGEHRKTSPENLDPEMFKKRDLQGISLVVQENKQRAGGIEIDKILQKEADLSGLREDVTLRDALEIVRTSVEPPLPLLVMWNDLSRNLAVDPERPIGFEIKGKAPLGVALELVLSSSGSSSQRPVLLREGDLLLVVSPQFAVMRMRPKIYDIGELTSFGILGEMDSGSTGNFGGTGK